MRNGRLSETKLQITTPVLFYRWLRIELSFFFGKKMMLQVNPNNIQRLQRSEITDLSKIFD